MAGQYARYPVSGGGGGVTSLNTLTGAVVIAAGSGLTLTPAGNTLTLSANNAGTVTSVGLADSTGLFTVSGSPVTSSGTLTLASLNSQTAKSFLAAPTASSGAPTFRGLVLGDLPTQANNTILGNISGITAAPLALTVAQVNSVLPVFTSTLNGLAPLSGGGTTNFLRADGTWTTPAGGGSVSSVSVVTANGFAGTVANATSTPAITLTTSVTGILQGNGTSISAATTTGTGSVVLGTSPTITLGNGTGLPLTTGVTGVLPLANGGTNANLTASNGALPYSTASAIALLAPGTSGQALVSAGAAAPVWSWPSVPTAVKTTTYAIAASDTLVLVDASSASFTTTLPTAVGISGATIRIKRVDQTLANAVTLATTSSQTIDGVTTKTLATQYEEWAVVSDGSNWRVISHTFPQSWVAYTPTFTGMGTVINNATFWRRVGDSMEVNSFFTVGVATAVTAKMSFPTGLSLDTTKISSGTTRCGAGNQVAITSSLIILSDSSNTTVFQFANVANGTNFTPQVGTAALGSANTALTALVPISGWNG